MIATAKHKSGSSGSCLGYMLGDMLKKDQQVRVVAYEGFALSRLKIAEIESIPSTEEEKAEHKKAVWGIANNLSKVFDTRAALADYRVNDPLEDYVVSFVNDERERLRRNPTQEEREQYELPKLKKDETDERPLERIVLEEFLAEIGVHGEIEKRLRRKGKDGKKYTLKQRVLREAMFLAVAHDGTAHPHMHVLTARPDVNGLVNDTREERRRILATVNKLSKKYNLSMKLDGYEVDLEKTNGGYAAMIMARNSAQDALKTATTREELKEMLDGAGVVPSWKVHSKTGEVYAILFTITDKHGKKHTWSGSQLDRALSCRKVEATLARNLATRQEATTIKLAVGAVKRATVVSLPEGTVHGGAPVKQTADAQGTSSFRPETKTRQPDSTASLASAPVKESEEKTDAVAAKKAQKVTKKTKQTKQTERKARQEERKLAKQAEKEALQQRILEAFALFEKLDAYRAQKSMQDISSPKQRPTTGASSQDSKTDQMLARGTSRPAVRGTVTPRPEPVAQAAIPTSHASMPEEGMSQKKETGQNTNSLIQSVAPQAADTSHAKTATPSESTMPVKGAGGVHRETAATQTAAPVARALAREAGLSNAELREAKPVAKQKQASGMTSAQSAPRPEPMTQETGVPRPKPSEQAGSLTMQPAAIPGASTPRPESTEQTAGQVSREAKPAAPKTFPKIIQITPQNYGGIQLPEGYRVHEEDGFIILSTPALVENNLVVEGKGYVLVHMQDGSYECRTAERHERIKGNLERYKKFNQPGFPALKNEQRTPNNKLRK